MNPRIPHLKWHCPPQLYQLSSENHYASLSAMFNPIHSISTQELFEKHLYNPRIPKEKNSATRNNCLNSEVSITLCCQLCSTRYTVVRIKNCLKSTSAIKIATMKISVTEGSHHVIPPNRDLLLSAKMNGTQRRTLVSP